MDRRAHRLRRRPAPGGRHRGPRPLLARRLPASYAAFDLLADGGRDLRALPYEQRRARLLEVLGPLGPRSRPYR